VDDRLPRLRAKRDLATAARLARSPDLPRVIGLGGVQWVGVTELFQRLRDHEAIGIADKDLADQIVAPARLFRG
jgi:hypothetical protein